MSLHETTSPGTLAAVSAGSGTDRTREVLGIGSAAITLLMALSLASYDVRGGDNWIGVVGQALAEALASAFGVSAWLVPVETALATSRLFTGRRAAIWPAPFRDELVWGYARQIGATYLLQGPLDHGLNGSAPDDFDAFIQRNHDRLDLIFTNPWFRLYRMTIPPEGSTTAHAGPEGRR